jgi:hypothetical protein
MGAVKQIATIKFTYSQMHHARDSNLFPTHREYVEWKFSKIGRKVIDHMKLKYSFDENIVIVEGIVGAALL